MIIAVSAGAIHSLFYLRQVCVILRQILESRIIVCPSVIYHRQKNKLM